MKYTPAEYRAVAVLIVAWILGFVFLAFHLVRNAPRNLLGTF